MTDNPTPAPAQDTHGSYGYCAWHQAFASNVRLIVVHEQGSGPGGGAFACHSCRVAYDLTPFADQVL